MIHVQDLMFRPSRPALGRVRVRSVGALVVVCLALAGCGGGATGTSSPATEGGTTDTATVSIDAFAFAPAGLTVKTGAVVTWTNQQAVTHAVTGDDAEFDSAQLPEGAEFSQTFDTAGVFPYHCTIHPNMTGTITVQE